ncbi:MAG: alanine racemase [Pseudomonadota bacterium]
MKTVYRPTIATIDLQALEYNFQTLKSLVPPAVGILGMVKADAYGHGAVQVSQKLIENQIDVLGVATVEEGIELRQAKIEAPILVMGGLMGMGGPATDGMVESNLIPVVHSKDVLDCLELAAQKYGRQLSVHLKVDTGMSRLGVRPEFLSPLLEGLAKSKSIRVEGVMTHLAAAEDKDYTTFQLEVFLRAKQEIEKKLGEIPVWHFSNSAAIIAQRSLAKFKAAKIWVRPGIALYGYADGLKLPPEIKLKPVMGVQSKIALLKRVPQGTAVSYGCTFKTAKDSRLGAVPIGYADGYRFNFTDKAYVLVRGKRAPVVGRVTMDMIMVDVTNLPEISVGDDVVILGSQGNEQITADEMASWIDSISYEILCGISRRIPRIYK